MSTELRFASFDSTELFGVLDLPTAPRALAVIVHGLCEHLGRYQYVTDRLLAQQIAVFRFDHRGHGRSDGKRVFYSDFRDIVRDTLAALDLAKREVPDLPTFVIGHSMGGYATTLLATLHPDAADGFVLSGALTRYNTPILGDLPILADPETYVPNALADGVCTDPAVAAAYEADPLVEKAISIGLINSIGTGLEFLKQDPAQFVAPVLILHGAIDGLVAEKDSRELYGDIGSQDKTLIIYAGLMHEIFREIRRDDVLADMIAWLNRHI